MDSERIEIQVRGSCGILHKTFRDWQDCPRCATKDSVWQNEIWNAAVDACIEVANKYDSYGPAYEMRTLKK